MLKALTNQLRILAGEDEQGFRKSIEKRLGGRATEEQMKAVKEFIFLLPPVLQQLSNYWNDESFPSEAKRLSGHIITYIYAPHDYLSEEQHGLFGYLDDAYLVVSAFLRIQDSYLKNWQDKSPLELQLVKRARELILVPDLVIPEEAKEIEALLHSWAK
ncbi:MAG: hypothetical protein AMJ41_03645 [candidate division Zixibacteria bacterium DG_27]|nr:MAG: hypothetical protein AMJ41_03645 [candidate division Zixibacteria bacterium DG_27]